MIKLSFFVFLLYFTYLSQGFSQMPDTICELVKIEKVETLERHFVLCVKFYNSNLNAKIIKIKLYGQEQKYETDSLYRICMRNVFNDIPMMLNSNSCLMLDHYDKVCVDEKYYRFYHFIKEIDEL